MIVLSPLRVAAEGETGEDQSQVLQVPAEMQEGRAEAAMVGGCQV